MATPKDKKRLCSLRQQDTSACFFWGCFRLVASQLMLFQRHIQENTKKKRHTDHIEHLKKNENFKQNWDQRTAPFKTQVNQKKKACKKKRLCLLSARHNGLTPRKKGEKGTQKGKKNASIRHANQKKRGKACHSKRRFVIHMRERAL